MNIHEKVQIFYKLATMSQRESKEISEMFTKQLENIERKYNLMPNLDRQRMIQDRENIIDIRFYLQECGPALQEELQKAKKLEEKLTQN